VAATYYSSVGQNPFSTKALKNNLSLTKAPKKLVIIKKAKIKKQKFIQAVLK